MNHNILLFRLYLFVSLLFLLPLSFLITVQFLSFFKIGLLLNNSNNGKSFFKELFQFFTIRKQWFLCISWVELSFNLNFINKNIFYNCLSYCYQENGFLYIAEYYALKALAMSPSDLIILNSLATIYKQLGQLSKLENISNKISMLD
uniref:Uncharacterized protein n=1 Tax=Kuetzingia canaliculata TaxID=228262 RepID=A0A1Z1MNY6_KUECA|nr:hypothetical protein [Kuetzingia canaliculata]ARW67768.1 hypothetical protein [Kuetzingia canaliculata]